MPTSAETDTAIEATPYQPIKTSRAKDVAEKFDANITDSGFSDSGQDNPTSFKFTQLYRYATPFDKFLLAVGILTTGVNGALFPFMAIVFGNVLTGFSSVPIDMDAVNKAALDFTLIAVGLFFTDYLSYVSFYYSAERQMKVLRSEALRRMLYLDVSWYDKNDALQLSSRLTGDTVKIKDGMGQKLGDSIRYTIQFFVGFGIGFVRGWDITLVMACVIPFTSMSLSWVINTMRIKSEWAQKIYAEAGSVAEEALGSIRTVASLNAEKKAITKFEAKVLLAERENIAMHKTSSLVLAGFLGSSWIMQAIGLWYGGWKASQGNTTPGDVFAAFFGVMMGAGSLGQISPNITAVSNALGAAKQLFVILDTPSTIDAEKVEGIVPNTCDGKIEAVDVNFAYPSRPDAQILRNYNVSIAPGQTVAFAGSSGGGKSTLIALLERFYDPTNGTIYLDGRDVKTLNVKWLRSQIGMVSQEPVLFATTIFENIAMGGSNVTREEAIEACKLSNAHTFIMSLPENYDTLVGEKGVSLSGGQKQRVAIARAIVRKPSILVLDEATSALDNESEKIVQQALNDLMASTNMTTLVIAHRLSTIRNADKIVVLKEGHIVESGSHNELLNAEDGIYRSMYRTQELRSKEEQQQKAHAEVTSSFVPRTMLSRTVSAASTNTDISVNKVETNILEKKPFGLKDLAEISRPERKYYVMGLIGACIGGILTPASALLVAEMITSMTGKFGLYEDSGDRKYLSELYDNVQLYGIMYIVGAVAIVVFTFLQTYSFKFIGEKVTTRLRNANFEGLCRQNIGFFDDKKNATGALTADLATNAVKVALLSGDSQAQAWQAVFTMLAALVISFGFGSWLLSLIMLAILPLLAFGILVRMKEIEGNALISDDLAVPGAHASEVLGNIRTIASLGIEQKSVDVFDKLLEEPLRKGSKEAHVNGLSLGFSSFIFMAAYALIFWFGAKKVDDGAVSVSEMMRTLMAIMMSIQIAGTASKFFGDAPKAFQAGSTIFAIRDRIAPIDAFSSDGIRLPKLEGRLEFKDISFRYPTRPEVSVLKHYNLTIEAGETVAFCGPSGGGKSTIISLIERFYDPVAGEVMLDGYNIKNLNLSWMRNHIGLVGQEPTLFIGTIAENIAYGLTDKPTQAEIEEAAKMANAHDFIIKFPDGYDTQVGMKGEQLSGGQKQRIAIARAILKNPDILLLDEATSALDSESEKVVQDALDKVVALKQRTTIIIAHRLSTIRKADKICVVSGGRIAEQGTHQELLGLNGIYAGLVASASS
ncbi:Multidrug resistance protein ABC Superfamily [Phytophthora cinnamomi]|uniref:Multidrug resistance protein ABC Superfamily n=1 Tax=Phytophthora cinnamomi TaxID=4785 RepID=UPI0035599679|nr:Multidrug resistance protein ABC Superfamily [Phytophthora cinnamomi]